MSGLADGLKQRVNETKLDMKVKDNVQLGIEAQMLSTKRLKLMEQVEAHQMIAREHEIDLKTAKEEEA